MTFAECSTTGTATECAERKRMCQTHGVSGIRLETSLELRLNESGLKFAVTSGYDGVCVPMLDREFDLFTTGEYTHALVKVCPLREGSILLGPCIECGAQVRVL
jgi:hypothetical protein